MMRNPSTCQSPTATWFDSTTALNCIAAYPCSRAQESAYSPSARPTPRPRALLATMKLAVETCEPGPGRFGPMCAVPSTRGPSEATTVRPGGSPPTRFGPPPRTSGVVGEGLADLHDLAEDGPEKRPVGVGVSA